MNDPSRGEITEGAVLPKKQFLTEEQLLEIWETRGMKFRCDELHQHLIERGLLPHNRKDALRKKVLGMLRAFFVEGDMRRDPRFVPPLKRIKRV